MGAGKGNDEMDDSQNITNILESMLVEINAYQNDKFVRQPKHLANILDYCKELLKEVGE